MNKINPLCITIWVDAENVSISQLLRYIKSLCCCSLPRWDEMIPIALKHNQTYSRDIPIFFSPSLTGAHSANEWREKLFLQQLKKKNSTCL